MTFDIMVVVVGLSFRRVGGEMMEFLDIVGENVNEPITISGISFSFSTSSSPFPGSDFRSVSADGDGDGRDIRTESRIRASPALGSSVPLGRTSDFGLLVGSTAIG